MAAKEIIVKKYVVRLSDNEHERLATLIRKGRTTPEMRLNVSIDICFTRGARMRNCSGNGGLFPIRAHSHDRSLTAELFHLAANGHVPAPAFPPCDVMARTGGKWPTR